MPVDCGAGDGGDRPQLSDDTKAGFSSSGGGKLADKLDNLVNISRPVDKQGIGSQIIGAFLSLFNDTLKLASSKKSGANDKPTFQPPRF